MYFETMNMKPNYSELGRIHGIDRRTAKNRYLGIEKKQKKQKTSKLDKYSGLIKEKLNIPGSNMKAVYMYIVMNVDKEIGSYSNFRKYIKNRPELYDKKKNQEAHVLFETSYGKQLQFDWKGPINLHSRKGELFKFYIFSSTLCASRLHVYVYSKFMTLEKVEECLIKTFLTIGGIPEECLTDNMSSIVNYSQNDFTKEFKSFCKDMGFIPKHCKKGHCYTKGKDESCNRFVNWLLPYDYSFDTEEELIEIVEKITKEVNKQPNQTTNMPPISLFQKEKEYLNPLPNQTIIDSYLDNLVPVKVQNTMLFYFKGCQYSVPKKYIDQTVKVQEIDNKLYVYYNKKLIAVHEKTNQKINYREEDYKEGLKTNIWSKDMDEIEELAKNNLELLSQITK